MKVSTLSNGNVFHSRLLQTLDSHLYILVVHLSEEKYVQQNIRAFRIISPLYHITVL